MHGKRTYFSLFIYFVMGIFIGRLIIPENILNPFNCASQSISTSLSSNVHIVNTSEQIDASFRCIQTKTLLNYVSTTICLHDTQKDIYVSGAFQEKTSIWEEGGVSRILQLLLRHPHLDFIDIGANIGTYTMYAAALGRFVMAIDCFAPNVHRLHRAVQLANLGNRVMIVQNAIYSRSGELLRLSNDPKNIGGQAISPSKNGTSNQTNIDDPYLVKTVQFDELLPLLLSRGVRGAILKVDIEGSESFVVESGKQMFDILEIPFIQMEWLNVRHHADRIKILLDFFAKRTYLPFTLACQTLDLNNILAWPDDLLWIKGNSSSFC